MSHNSNAQERILQTTQIPSTTVLQTKDTANSKHTATINRKKQLRTAIKAPDILNTETCVNLDLVSSNLQDCSREKLKSSSACNLAKTNYSVNENTQNISQSNLDSTPNKQNPKAVCFNENNVPIANSSSSELQACCDNSQCSKCVQIANKMNERTDRNPNNSSKPVMNDDADLPKASNGNMDAVMCSISNDLDYLLNRSNGPQTN